MDIGTKVKQGKMLFDMEKNYSDLERKSSELSQITATTFSNNLLNELDFPVFFPSKNICMLSACLLYFA